MRYLTLLIVIGLCFSMSCKNKYDKAFWRVDDSVSKYSKLYRGTNNYDSQYNFLSKEAQYYDSMYLYKDSSDNYKK